jgi:hypothetical protein
MNMGIFQITPLPPRKQNGDKITAVIILIKFQLLMNTISGLENREYGRRDPLRWPTNTFYPQKLELTADKRRPLGRYSSLAGSGHGVF